MGSRVPAVDEGADRGDEFVDGAERAASDGLAFDDAEPDLGFPPKKIPLENGTTVFLPVLVITSAYSRFVLGRMIPTETTEDLLAGMWLLFQQLGRVPRRLLWDNERGIGRGRHRSEGVPGFMGTLATRLVLLPPRDPESKGIVERRNGWIETSFMPGRSFASPADFNQQFTDWHLLSERPAEVEDRAVPGHWEGDLIIGPERSAIGTFVERASRCTMLVHLPRVDGYGEIPRTKNRPAPAGYGAVSMKNALVNTMSTLPAQLARSLTWDRSKEISAHALSKVETGIPVLFADPHSPWQRAGNENTNRLLRQHFPKGTDLSRWSTEEIEAVAHAPNTRPRKTLGQKTPAEALNEHLLLLQQTGGASTG